jgi:hypothetical protein
MHASSHAALALLLLSAQGAPAQAPLPPGFTDAAAVVDGLIVDMRYFGANNFVGERVRVAFCRCRRRTRWPRWSAIWRRVDSASRCSIATGRSARSPNSCAGRSGSTTSSANANSIPTRTSASCSTKAIFPIAPVTRAFDRRSHAGAARPWARARYGLAVRLLQPEVMAVGSERKRRGATKPRVARRRDAPRRLSALRQGMVALHARQRAVPGYVFRFPGQVSCATAAWRKGEECCLRRRVRTQSG